MSEKRSKANKFNPVIFTADKQEQAVQLVEATNADKPKSDKGRIKGGVRVVTVTVGHGEDSVKYFVVSQSRNAALLAVAGMQGILVERAKRKKVDPEKYVSECTDDELDILEKAIEQRLAHWNGTAKAA